MNRQEPIQLAFQCLTKDKLEQCSPVQSETEQEKAMKLSQGLLYNHIQKKWMISDQGQFLQDWNYFYGNKSSPDENRVIEDFPHQEKQETKEDLQDEEEQCGEIQKANKGKLNCHYEFKVLKKTLTYFSLDEGREEKYLNYLIGKRHYSQSNFIIIVDIIKQKIKNKFTQNLNHKLQQFIKYFADNLEQQLEAKSKKQSWQGQKMSSHIHKAQYMVISMQLVFEESPQEAFDILYSEGCYKKNQKNKGKGKANLDVGKTKFYSARYQWERNPDFQRYLEAIQRRWTR